jgi:hypothetical protein
MFAANNCSGLADYLAESLKLSGSFTRDASRVRTIDGGVQNSAPVVPRLRLVRMSAILRVIEIPTRDSRYRIVAPTGSRNIQGP